ncbi:Serralysin C precursor [Marinibacterium anthonyi]|nr:Serralysin C precursor [Marinibacterium anthonyi]
MCTMCQALDPSVTVYDSHLDTTLTDGGVQSSFSSDATTVYSIDQFADDLANGLGQQMWSVDMQAMGAITVNLDGLGETDKAAVLQALEEWSAQSGVSFTQTTDAMFTFEGTQSGGFSISTQSHDGDDGPQSLVPAIGADTALADDAVQAATTSAAKPVYSVDQIADYLTDGFWAANGQQTRSFDVQTGGTITVNINGLDAVGKATALQALDAWSAVTGLTFAQASNAMITFDDTQSGAYNSSSTSGTTIVASNVNVHTSWQGYGDYYLQTFIHEIGHAMGLGHGGMYNGTADFNTQAHYANDSWQMSVMSYFSNTENPNVSASFAYLATAQLADIVAIQNLYGTPTDIQTGNTIYGDNTTVSQHGMGLNTGKAVTIFDSGGTDTIDLGTRGYNQRIDLYAEHFSDMNGKTGNLAIARGTVIENVRTGSGADQIIGNTADNRLESGAGNDTILGEGGNDILVGGAGADTLTGGTGGDTYVYTAVGDAGDTITDFNLAQSDRIDLSGIFTELGYSGSDPVGDGMVWLSAATGGSWLMMNGGGLGSLAIAFLTGIAASVSIAEVIDVESVPVGPDPDAYDTLITLTNDYVLSWTEAGSIIRDTNGGTDTLDLSAVTYNCKIYLDGSTTGKVGSKVLTVDAGSDIENLIFGKGADYGYGNDLDNQIDGGAGGDKLYGRAGDDSLIGGEGNDKLYGEDGDDVITGDAGTDYLYGGAGVDDLAGGEGNDKLYGDDGDDVITGDAGNDYIYGGAGVDDVAGGDGNDKLYGDDGDDMITGGIGTDTLYGGLGNDTLDAGDGNDKLYGHQGDDVLDGGIGKDTLYGDVGDDTMTGGDDADRLYGGAGNDTMSGGDDNDYLKAEDGDDAMDGGAGDDKLYGGNGADVLDAGDGNDMLYGDNGDDVIYGGAGDDKIYGKSDDDTMFGDDGLDYIKGDAGDDYADGGAGNDKIYGDNGLDELYGGDGDDYIKAGNDADYVDGGAGIDKIYGDNGDDIMYGGDGDDYIKAGGDDDYVDGGAGADKIYGDNGDDIMYGGDGDDYIKSGGDDDYADGGAGNDQIYGDNGLDQLFGGDGDDYIKAGNDADLVSGGDGIDTLYGDNGDDQIDGGTGDDIIDGGGGNDVITGGAGADTIKGGSGSDVFIFTSVDDAGDYLSDFKLSQGDQISVSALLGGGTVSDALTNDIFALIADDNSSMLMFDTGSEIVELAYLQNLSADTLLSEDWLI